MRRASDAEMRHPSPDRLGFGFVRRLSGVSAGLWQKIAGIYVLPGALMLGF